MRFLQDKEGSERHEPTVNFSGISHANDKWISRHRTRSALAENNICGRKRKFSNREIAASHDQRAGGRNVKMTRAESKTV
jgi:hypothetical protein